MIIDFGINGVYGLSIYRGNIIMIGVMISGGSQLGQTVTVSDFTVKWLT